MLSLILLVASLVCFVLAAIPVPVRNINLVAAGLACLAGSMLASSHAL